MTGLPEGRRVFPSLTVLENLKDLYGQTNDDGNLKKVLKRLDRIRGRDI